MLSPVRYVLEVLVSLIHSQAILYITQTAAIKTFSICSFLCKSHQQSLTLCKIKTPHNKPYQESTGSRVIMIRIYAQCVLPTGWTSAKVGSMAQEDPHAWLEEVSGEKCLHWAKERRVGRFGTGLEALNIAGTG